MKQKVFKYLKEIQLLVDKISASLLSPEGIRITVVNKRGFKVVEYWDGEYDNLVTLFSSFDTTMDDNLSEEDIRKGIEGLLITVIGMVPISRIGKVDVEIVSDIEYDSLPDDTKKAIDVIGIDYNTMDEQYYSELKERYNDTISDMSEVKGVQETS